MAYRVASATGFRVQELRSLTPESFRIDRPDPSIFLRASSTKNRKPADQPISQSLAQELREWLRKKPRGQSVFPLHHDTAKAIRADLEACGIPYETEDGTADFHSLRSVYVSALVRSGASIAEVHKLARHAKPETTLKHYAKVSKHDLRGAVEKLPNPKQPALEPESLAATGTDGKQMDSEVSLLFPYVDVEQGSDKSGPDQTLDNPVTAVAIDPALENEMFDALRRLGTDSGTERGGFEPPKPVSQFNGLANRRYRPLSHLSWSGKARTRFPR